MTQSLLALALLASGPSAGVLIASLVGPVPALLALPPKRYVEMHRLMASRPEPFQPICFVTTVCVDAVLAASAETTTVRLLCSAAAVLAAGVIVVSKTRSDPIKRWSTSFDPEHLPEDWSATDPRPVWARWNRIRAALAIGALIANVCAVAALG